MNPPLVMDTTKQAGLWDKIKRLWRGKRDYEGPTYTEDQVVDKFAEDYVQQYVYPKSPEILRQIVVEANKAGLPHVYLPYVFWLIVEARNEWPDMHPKQAKALQIAEDLVMTQGDMPNYRPAVTLPEPEYEVAVDQVVRQTAMWALGALSASLLRGYAAALKKWAPVMVGAAGGDLSDKEASAYLRMLFEIYLEKRPHQFLDGDLLERVVFGLLR